MSALGTVTLGIPRVSREDVLGETRSRVLSCPRRKGIQQKNFCLHACLVENRFIFKIKLEAQ